MIWPSVFQGLFFLLAVFHNGFAQNDLGSYGVPEEPLITSETENQADEAEEHGGGGGHHHHHGGPLDWLRASVPGEPDVDYPIFNTPPDTGFECGDKADGMYADVDARCQVWHQCFADRKWSFLCPNGTIFNQEIFTCVWWFDFECESAESFYSLNDNLYKPSASANNGGNRGIGGAKTSKKETSSSQAASPRQPISQPQQPAARPRPAAPKSKPQPRPVAPKQRSQPRPPAPRSRPQPRPIAPKPQPQPRPVAPRAQPQPRPVAPRAQPRPTPFVPRIPPSNPLPKSTPIESFPAYVGASVPRQPAAPAIQPIRPVPSSAPLPPRQTPIVTPISIDSNNIDPGFDSEGRGTGINFDYDNTAEEGYNYKVPALENQLIIERPKKRKQPTPRPSPTPRSDEGLEIEAPLALYGAPPQPFDDGSNSFSNDIFAPPVEAEEDALPGYLPPDPREGRQSKNGRKGRKGRRGRGFNRFNRRLLRSINSVR